MSTDLMDRLRSVGELNDQWSNERLANESPSAAGNTVSVVSLPVPQSRRWQAVRVVAAAAVVLLAGTVAIALIDRDDSIPVATPSPTEAHASDLSMAPIGPSAVEWPAGGNDSLSGLTADGQEWSVRVDAGTWEVCYEFGPHRGCGSNGGRPVVIASDSSEQLVFGIVMPGEVAGLSTPSSGPAQQVRFQVGDSSSFVAEFVSDRLWASVIPTGTPVLGPVRFEWVGGSTVWNPESQGSGVDDAPDRGGLARAEIERQRAEERERARRAAEEHQGE